MSPLLHSLAALAQAAPAPQQAPNQTMALFMPLLFMGVIFYFALIRPQQKKQRETRDMINSLKNNDRVVTNGGIHGVVTGIKDRTVSLRVAEGVKIEFDKTAIVAVTRRDAAVDEAA
jgi:preprotein translocase subunit YajC